MILPGKKIPQDRALLTMGAQLLSLLEEPKTVSRLWQDLRECRAAGQETAVLPYDWFVLALDLLFALGAIRLDHGRIVASKR